MKELTKEQKKRLTEALNEIQSQTPEECKAGVDSYIENVWKPFCAQRNKNLRENTDEKEV